MYTPAMGQHLMDIEEYYFGISLYALKDFYVELWYLRKEQTIIKIQEYKDLSPFSPYLKRIRLDDIMEDQAL